MSDLGCLTCFEKLPLGPNPIPVLQLFVYGLTLFFGFLVCIPVGITLRRFHGNCILFGQVVWNQKYIWPWSETSCDFILYMNLGINIIYVALMILFLVVFVLPKYKKYNEQKVDKLALISKYHNKYVIVNMNPLMCAINIMIWFFQISGAIIITVGFSRFCNSLEESLDKLGTPMSCAEAEGSLDWTEYKIVQSEMNDGVNGSGFFISYNIAMICSWILLCLWTLQLVINFGQIFTRCSCAIAEEKVKIDASQRIAARRSRMATPSGTPGGRHTPVPYDQPMPPPSMRGPPSTSSYMPPSSMRGQPQQPGFVLQAPSGWGRGPESTSSVA